MEVILSKKFITAKQKNLLKILLMKFSMSRIVYIGQNALTIASKAANGLPAIQLLKNNNNNNKQTNRAWEWGSRVGRSYLSH